jgi:serine/threonine protein kinase
MKYCPLCAREFDNAVEVCDVDGAALKIAGVKQDLYIGKLIKGRYNVISKIGEGGMGSVYLAEQVSIGRKVALKVLQGTYASDDEFIGRFRREARLAASLNHRNIVTVYDFDQGNDGSLFIAMEYLQGTKLSDVIRRDGPLEINRAVRLAIQIAEGLGIAHQSGVIHRDIKPDNIMVVGNRGVEEIKLMDFGIARIMDTGSTTSNLTRAGMIMGTPAYMAPEQAEGATVSEQTDIYALGIVLYEMLSGSVPFKASTPSAVLIKQLQEIPTPLRKLRREVPGPLDSVVMRSLEKKPQKRPRDMREIAAQLQKLDVSAPAEESAKTMVGTMILEKVTSTWLGRVTEWLGQVRPALVSKTSAMISLLVVLGALGYWFFGGVKKEADSSKPELISMTVQGDRRELRIGEKIVLKAVGRLSDGSDTDKLEKVSWRSSDESVVAVNANGEAEGRKEGFADISVHSQGVPSAALTLMVKKPDGPPVEVRVQEHVRAAQDCRDRGDYSCALTELGKAQALDPNNSKIETELDNTKKACMAEQKVGLTKSKCE